LYAVLEALDRLILDRETPPIIDGAFGIVPVLASQGQDPVFESRIFRAQGLRETLALVHSRTGYDSAAGNRRQEEDHREETGGA